MALPVMQGHGRVKDMLNAMHDRRIGNFIQMDQPLEAQDILLSPRHQQVHPDIKGRSRQGFVDHPGHRADGIQMLQ